jgi:PhnB protein
MVRCEPFLLFDGTCAEAMTFYHQCLGGELTITKLGDSPMKDLLPKDKWERTIHAHLKSENLEISATDWMASPTYNPKQGNTFAIFVIGEGYDELKAVFDKISEGIEKEKEASRFQELHDLPFGTYGQLTDKFGVHWIFKGDKRA